MVSNRILMSAVVLTVFAMSAKGADSFTTNAASANAHATVVNNKMDYTPQIHGVIRSRWEGEFDDDEFGQRFQVKNARVSLAGNVLPALSYFIQIDACDCGKMKILDAYARWGFARTWRVQAGQFRVPFGVDCFRAPGSYYFANRSFIGKQMMNMREVGAKIGYYGTSAPLTVEGGVFNSAAMSDHNTWQRDMNYAVNASYRLHNVTLSAGYISAEPDAVRMNLVDGTVTWQTERWIVEGEYQNKHYTHSRHNSTNAWNIFTSYAMPLQHTTFNQLSFQARYDGMTDHSNGTRNAEGNLTTNDPARQRITVGSTLAFVQKPVKAAIRLNYEKYFYKSNVTAPKGDNDKIVAELVVKF